MKATGVAMYVGMVSTALHFAQFYGGVANGEYCVDVSSKLRRREQCCSAELLPAAGAQQATSKGVVMTP